MTPRASAEEAMVQLVWSGGLSATEGRDTLCSNTVTPTLQHSPNSSLQRVGVTGLDRLNSSLHHPNSSLQRLKSQSRGGRGGRAGGGGEGKLGLDLAAAASVGDAHQCHAILAMVQSQGERSLLGCGVMRLCAAGGYVEATQSLADVWGDEVGALGRALMAAAQAGHWQVWFKKI
jgi:hypothetical protein